MKFDCLVNEVILDCDENIIYVAPVCVQSIRLEINKGIDQIFTRN